MHVTRIFTDAGGVSQFEDLEIPTTDIGRGLETGVIPSTGTILRDRRGLPAMDMGFHVAPRRQLVVHVGGAMEVELADGTVRRFPSGSVVFADDTTGQGHKTRAGTDVELMVFVLLPADLDPAIWRSPV